MPEQSDDLEALSDAALLGRVGEGEMACFEVLYRRFEPRIFRFVSQRLNDHFAAADILHETMMTVWQKASSFEGRSAVSTWVFGIAYRKLMNSYRKHGREDLVDDMPEQVDESPDQTMSVAAGDAAQQIERCLDDLSPSHRAVIELAFQEDLSYREISDIVGTPEGTVKTRVFHAKRLLRNCLEKHAGHFEDW